MWMEISEVLVVVVVIFLLIFCYFVILAEDISPSVDQRRSIA
jgi:hypothetical protein